MDFVSGPVALRAERTRLVGGIVPWSLTFWIVELLHEVLNVASGVAEWAQCEVNFVWTSEVVV